MCCNSTNHLDDKILGFEIDLFLSCSQRKLLKHLFGEQRVDSGSVTFFELPDRLNPALVFKLSENYTTVHS